MLILTRKLGESIIIDENVQISVIEINKNNIKIGVNAPKELTIYREEVFLKIKEENSQSSSSGIIDFVGLLMIQRLKYNKGFFFYHFNQSCHSMLFCKHLKHCNNLLI